MDNMRNQILQGDCLEILRTLDANSVDSCVVDPPYGLGEVKDIAGLLMAWMNDTDDKAYVGKSGFMNKEWDSGVPGPRYWKEVLRVLKPGAHILAFAGTRTYDLLVIALRLAGFEIRDQIDWLYGSGFPKSHDISKAIDRMKGAEREVIETNPNHRLGHSLGIESTRAMRCQPHTGNGNITAPATPEAERYSGFGTNLKPAHEPICLARKPLAESSIAANVLEWGVGAINIDASRVGNELVEAGRAGRAGKVGNGYRFNSENADRQLSKRWPANLLLSHSVFCVPNGTKKVRANRIGVANPHDRPDHPTYGKYGYTGGSTSYNDSEGMEQVEDWLCTDDCPIYQLDLQSGNCKSGGGVKNKAGHSIGLLHGEEAYHFRHDGIPYEPSEGGASRYFMRFYYCSKASRSERNLGCEGLPEKESFDKNTSKQIAHINHATGATTYNEYHPSVNANNHPCVKPQKLIQYLVRLITPPGGIVLDCFGGSGTTALACIAEGFDYLIIEQEQAYIEIAEARIQHALAEVA